MESPPLLEMHGIAKRFGDVQANDGVNLTLNGGDILGLLGENGAGKTTLMNILFGVYAADSGRIAIDGRPVQIRSSADALAHGVGMVHQHFHLVPRHTVLENLMVGQSGRGMRLDRGFIRQRMREIEQRFGLHLPPDARVCDLTIGEQQRLEIMKALIRGARILILDEPTAALTPQEAEGLFTALRAMAARQMGVIFISHKLQEIAAVTTRVVVMQQGRVAAEVANDDTVSKRRLAELMIGHEITPPSKGSIQPGAVRLRLENLQTRGGARPSLKGVSLEVRGGEILGVAGVSGNGQAELADVIAGVLPASGGTLEINGRPVTRFTPREVQALGVGRIPEDRMATGLIPALPLRSCMVLPRIREPRFSRCGFLKHGAISRFADQQIKSFGIKAAGNHVRTGILSGGNLQKALLARELAWEPTLLLAAQPTRGLDVAAARFVHQRFLELRSRDGAMVLISEDLEEIFALSDRIAVMYEGRVMDVLDIHGATVAKVGLLMAGVREEA
jgi:simple sugar transport system ATP-binding protein